MSTPGEHAQPDPSRGQPADPPPYGTPSTPASGYGQPQPSPYGPPAGQPVSYGSPRATGAALGAALVVVVAGVAAASVSGIGGLVIGGVFTTFVRGLLLTVFFAGGALLSLTLIKQLPPGGRLSRFASPLLLAGGFGTVGVLVIQVVASLLSTPPAFADWVGRFLAGSIFSGIAEGILLTAILAFGAFASALRGRAGIPSPVGTNSATSLALTAAIASLVVLVASGLVNSVYLLIISGLGLAPVFLLFRVVVFAAVAFVALAFIRPLSRVATVSGAYVSTAVAGAIATAVLLVIDLVGGLVQGNPGYYVFGPGLASSVSDGILFTFTLGFGVIVALLRTHGVPAAVPSAPGASAQPMHPYPPQQPGGGYPPAPSQPPYPPQTPQNQTPQNQPPQE